MANCHEYRLSNPKVCFSPAVYKKDKLLIPTWHVQITIFILHGCHEYRLSNPKVCFSPAVYKKTNCSSLHGEFNITIFILHRLAICHEYRLSNPKVCFSPAVYKKDKLLTFNCKEQQVIGIACWLRWLLLAQQCYMSHVTHIELLYWPDLTKQCCLANIARSTKICNQSNL